MFLRTEEIKAKKLVGKKVSMTYAVDRTFELWRSFMPQRHQVKAINPSSLFSLQIYNSPRDFESLSADTQFTKWALLEVADFNEIPAGMEPLRITGGLYAVFLHRGLPSGFPATIGYIINQWLPGSGYCIDHREHFEVLGERYRRDSEESEEEVWVPIEKCVD